MHELFLEIQQVASGNSPMHRLDAGTKLLSILILILFAVFTKDLFSLVLLEIFLLMLMAASHLPPRYVGKRLLFVLPFGGFLALFQPFIREGSIIWSFYGLSATYEGTFFGALLLLRMLVCISAVLFLSSTTRQEDLYHALERFKVPPIFISLLDMMLRHIGLCFESLHRALTAQKARGFRWRKNRAGYRFVLKSAGNTLGTLFVRSMERGERIYESMLARGYKLGTSYSFEPRRRANAGDACLLLSSVFIVVFLAFQDRLWYGIGLV
ncbi:MAG: cobalt ECF transporter T component CbiQ [Thermoplasmata archaeon]|nr:cobalt ECF transporter T component CbiQ [Thermoplasmata archaeon]